MKFSLATTTVLLGAASAAAPQQHVLNDAESFAHEVKNTFEQAANSNAWEKPLHSFGDALKSLTGDARKAWDEVSLLFPEQMSKASFFSSPKPHVKKPDSVWDYVVKGAEIQDMWVENAKTGEKERHVDGKLEAYNLRAKKVDPAKLGVDTVKQYSGYLVFLLLFSSFSHSYNKFLQ
jgi:cathepsin A (carboxypeptidase C)